MKIIAFAHRCLRALIGPWGRLALHAHPAADAPVIRIPRHTASKPIVRWRMNPVSGRLECRWTVNQPTDGSEPSGFERFGAILALRENARPWS
ncbi:hypothetical protein C1M53_22165 [Mesorhizobium sp. Pch-S]|nr:hypothetical protein C1M53_22165 [Mesorhizobium sp. Pch-S]